MYDVLSLFAVALFCDSGFKLPCVTFLPKTSKVCHFCPQIGPNVSLSANVRVGAGVRLISCIVLDDVEIKVLKLVLVFNSIFQT